MGERTGQEGRGRKAAIGSVRLFDVSGALAILILPVALFFVVVSMFIGAILVPFNHRDRYATDPVEVDIGMVGYTVPNNYLSFLPQGEPSGFHYVRLMVLRRGFEPRTEDNAAERIYRDEDGRQIGAWNPGAVVSIRISNRDLLGIRRLERLVELGGSPTEAADYGLARYTGGSLDRRDETYYTSGDDYQAGDGGPAVIVCDSSIGGMPEIYDVIMKCEGGYRAPDGAWIQYEYYTNDLSDWRRIDEEVRALIGGFARTQPMPG